MATVTLKIRDAEVLMDAEWARYFSKYSMSINEGYLKAYIEGKSVKTHRIIANAQDGQIVDHINGDKLDNRISNLRLVTHAQNMANRACNKTSTSGYKGVYYDNSMSRRKRWGASIHHAGKRITIGRYFTAEDAASAYDEVALKLKGQFARLNFRRIES